LHHDRQDVLSLKACYALPMLPRLLLRLLRGRRRGRASWPSRRGGARRRPQSRLVTSAARRASRPALATTSAAWWRRLAGRWGWLGRRPPTFSAGCGGRRRGGGAIS
jgi:hypothetical protein